MAINIDQILQNWDLLGLNNVEWAQRTKSILDSVLAVKPLAPGTQASPRGTAEEQQAYQTLQAFQSRELQAVADQLGLGSLEGVAAFDTPEGEKARQMVVDHLKGVIEKYSKSRVEMLQSTAAEDRSKLEQEYRNVLNAADAGSIEDARKYFESLPGGQGGSWLQRLDAINEQVTNYNSNPQYLELIGQQPLQLPGLTRTADGYELTSDVEAGIVPGTPEYQPSFGTQGVEPGTPGHSGTFTRVEQQPDGTFAILDANTGEVMESGLPSEAAALSRQNQLQAGSTPQLTGQPTVFATEPVLPEEQAALASGQATVATPEQLAQAGGATASATASITGSLSADTVVTGLETGVASQEAAFVASNPGVEVTPEMRAMWLAQARAEFSPYFQEQIRLAEFDLGTSLNRLIEDTRLRELELNVQTKEGFENLQQSLQQRGMLYGGEGGGTRGQEQRQFTEQANLNYYQLGRGLERGLQDVGMQGERTLGTAGAEQFFGGFSPVQSVGLLREGEPTFGPTQALDVFQPMGNILGDIPREQTYQEESRATDLEELERTEFSQFA